jgi:preprotein translocase subunit SecE
MKQRKKQVGARWIAKVRGVIRQVEWTKRQRLLYRAVAASKDC